MQSNVLITGCCGFIGSSLTDRLLANGYTVYGIDCFNDNYSKSIKLENIKSALSNSKFTLLEKDLNQLELDDISKLNIRYVIHLAAQPGVRDSWGPEFVKYVKNNIDATQRLLEIIIRCPSLKRFINGSSSSVYGDNNSDKPIPINFPTNPLSPYGVTKLTAEKLVKAYAMNYGFEYVNLRFFTVYGPRQRPDMAFSKFIKKAMAGETLIIFGDGTQKRDFTFIEDIVEGIVLSMNQGSGDYNLGRGKSIQLREALAIIQDYFPNIKIQFENPQRGDVKSTWADISNSTLDLGYSPKVDIQEGLIRQIEWMKERISY